MIITIEKPQLEIKKYIVSYPTGKKTNRLEIFEGSVDWNTQSISNFLVDLADSTSDLIELNFGANLDDEIINNDMQLKTLKDLFGNFIEEINKSKQ